MPLNYWFANFIITDNPTYLVILALSNISGQPCMQCQALNVIGKPA
jgi:hypothetical protein